MVVVGQFMLLYMKYTILKTGLNRSRGGVARAQLMYQHRLVRLVVI